MSSRDLPSSDYSTTARVGNRRLIVAALIAIVLAGVANLAIRALATGPLGQPADFPPFLPVAVVLSTIIGVSGATVVFALVTRFASRPVRTFIMISVVALAVSLVPNALLVANPSAFPFPGVSIGTVGTLAAMHVATAIITVYSLIRLTRST